MNILPEILPLFPVTHADSSPKPFINILHRSVILRNTIVVHSTRMHARARNDVSDQGPNILIQFIQSILHGYTPGSSGQVLHLIMKILKRSFSPPDLHPLGKESLNSKKGIYSGRIRALLYDRVPGCHTQ